MWLVYVDVNSVNATFAVEVARPKIEKIRQSTLRCFVVFSIGYSDRDWAA